MKTGLFQFAPVFGDINRNLKRIENVLMETDADLMVLPELCTTGYQFISDEEVRALCEPVPDGPSVWIFEKICREKRMHLVAGIGELDGSACYNSAVLVGPEGYIGTYRKVHLFDEEKLWFSSGDRNFQVWDIGIARVGIMICFDWIFPESVRSLALAGADVICHPSNLVLPYCPDAMITRSIENRVFTVTANRTGQETRGGKKPLTYIGLSQITHPNGERLVRFGREEEGVRTVEIDPLIARNKKITSRNDLFEDRRETMYL